jgi:hypothetical protein
MAKDEKNLKAEQRWTAIVAAPLVASILEGRDVES